MAARDDMTTAPVSIREEACQWVVRLDSGKLSAEVEQAFREWVARSPRHRAEVDRLGVLWDGLDELVEPRMEAAVATVVSENLGRYWNLLIVAGVVAAAVALLFIILSMLHRVPVSSAFYATQVGEHRSIALSDGSSVILNTDSQIEKRFGGGQRRIRLVRGEAVFDVAGDKSRPFCVLAGTGVVCAVGTSFAVYLHRDHIEVTVTEGRVELSTYAAAPAIGASPHQQPTVLAQIDAGQHASFGASIDTVTRISAADIDRKLSWRTGVLIFDNATLEQVIGNISRYSRLNFIISDASIKDLRLSGRFSTVDPAELLSVLETSLGIQVDRSEAGRVYLSKAGAVPAL